MRSHYSSEVNESLVDKTVEICGWVHRRRLPRSDESRRRALQRARTGRHHQPSKGMKHHERCQMV